MRERRVRRVSVQNEMFLRILRSMDGLRRVRCEGLPDDAETVGVRADLQRDCIEIYLASASFDPVDEGSLPPDLHLNFTEYYGDAKPETPDAISARQPDFVPTDQEGSA